MFNYQEWLDGNVSEFELNRERFDADRDIGQEILEEYLATNPPMALQYRGDGSAALIALGVEVFSTKNILHLLSHLANNQIQIDEVVYV